MDFIEEHRSHVLFIPSIFIEDCIDESDMLDTMHSDQQYELKPEDINLIRQDSNSDTESQYSIDDLPDNISDSTNRDILMLADLAFANEIIYDSVPKFFINKNKWISTTNLKCVYCHDVISGIPYPIALGLNKILIPSDGFDSDIFVDFHGTKTSDDNLIFNCQLHNEVRAYRIHNVLCGDIVCAGNYIRKIQDAKIINKKESLRLTIDIYKEITGEIINDIPEKDLWIVMKQYCGDTGISQNDYRKRNADIELNLKLAMNI